MMRTWTVPMMLMLMIDDGKGNAGDYGDSDHDDSDLCIVFFPALISNILCGCTCVHKRMPCSSVSESLRGAAVVCSRLSESVASDAL